MSCQPKRKLPSSSGKTDTAPAAMRPVGSRATPPPFALDIDPKSFATHPPLRKRKVQCTVTCSGGALAKRPQVTFALVNRQAATPAQPARIEQLAIFKDKGFYVETTDDATLRVEHERIKTLTKILGGKCYEDPANVWINYHIVISIPRIEAKTFVHVATEEGKEDDGPWTVSDLVRNFGYINEIRSTYEQRGQGVYRSAWLDLCWKEKKVVGKQVYEVKGTCDSPTLIVRPPIKDLYIRQHNNSKKQPNGALRSALDLSLELQGMSTSSRTRDSTQTESRGAQQCQKSPRRRARIVRAPSPPSAGLIVESREVSDDDEIQFMGQSHKPYVGRVPKKRKSSDSEVLVKVEPVELFPGARA